MKEETRGGKRLEPERGIAPSAPRSYGRLWREAVGDPSKAGRPPGARPLGPRRRAPAFPAARPARPFFCGKLSEKTLGWAYLPCTPRHGSISHPTQRAQSIYLPALYAPGRAVPTQPVGRAVPPSARRLWAPQAALTLTVKIAGSAGKGASRGRRAYCPEAWTRWPRLSRCWACGCIRK